MKFSYLAIILAASAPILLSSCVDMPAAGDKITEGKATVISGKKTKISATADIKADCEFAGYPYTAAIKPPAHGKIEVEHEEVHVQYSKDSIAYICSNKPVQGNAIYYTSDPGFTGTDQFTLRLSALRVYGVQDRNVTVKVVK